MLSCDGAADGDDDVDGGHCHVGHRGLTSCDWKGIPSTCTSSHILKNKHAIKRCIFEF